jgi:hypothetical protein
MAERAVNRERLTEAGLRLSQRVHRLTLRGRGFECCLPLSCHRSGGLEALPIITAFE